MRCVGLALVVLGLAGQAGAQRGGSLRGTVLGPDGIPVAGADVGQCHRVAAAQREAGNAGGQIGHLAGGVERIAAAAGTASVAALLGAGNGAIVLAHGAVNLVGGAVLYTER